MYKKVIFFAVFMLVAGIIEIRAQHAAVAAGGNFSGSGGSVSYSLGQVAFTVNKSSEGSVVQGVQQPYEISVYTGISETGVDLELTAYPNPVSSYLILNVADLYKGHEQLYQLFDINGKLIKEGGIFENETNIDMLNLNPGTYFLKVVSTNSLIKTFKIIKK